MACFQTMSNLEKCLHIGYLCHWITTFGLLAVGGFHRTVSNTDVHDLNLLFNQEVINKTFNARFGHLSHTDPLDKLFMSPLLSLHISYTISFA